MVFKVKVSQSLGECAALDNCMHTDFMNNKSQVKYELQFLWLYRAWSNNNIRKTSVRQSQMKIK